ncbi:MAG: amino acid permease [Planctomycetes bacterium]|nr:amino acid permease [Planctomycetota bacterium]
MSGRHEEAPAGAGTAPCGAGLGTFAGVFTPSILTILGIILFLRLGYVVGAAGLGRALLIIALANLISVLTTFSLATIATNLRVKGGGDYYLISRTLGIQYGGALGIVLFLAQSISVAFYAIGFGEALAAALGLEATGAPQVIAAAAVAGLLVLVWFGADVATRFQFVIMAVLGLGILGFVLGALPDFDADRMRNNWSAADTAPFWLLFAIFFPAATGFTQGVSMSGDLRDPGRSLPRGTFLAVGLSAAVYLGCAVLFAGALPGSELVRDYDAMRRVSIAAWLVDAGVIAATLSSALASFLGAPRILQSLARDRIFGFLTPLAHGQGPADNPRRAALLAAAIAFATVGLGDLNLVAPVVAMFFLVSYGLLNYATWFEARGRSPSFRPTFRWYHPALSLVGFLACLGVMLAIHAAAGAVAVAVLFGLHEYVKRTVTTPRWADSGRSHHLQRIRERLHALTPLPDHARDWRPVILAFSDHPERRARTIRFASWLEGASGFTTAVKLLAGEGAAARRERARVEAEMRGDVAARALETFCRVVVAPDPGEALPVVLQAHGLGDVRANTVLLNWFDHAPGPEDPPGLERYGRYLRLALRFGCSVVILGVSTEDYAAVAAMPRDTRRIDVWYPDETDGQLMLLFAYLMTRTPDWEEATIRVFAPPVEGTRSDERVAALARMLEEVRIPAVPRVATWDAESVIRESGDAAAVFLPFGLDDSAPVSAFAGSLSELIDRTHLTVLVRAAQEIDLDAAPEEGQPGELAAAEDRAADAAAAARRAEKDAEKAVEAARKTAEKSREALEAGAAAPEETTRVARAAEAAEAAAEKMRRRAIKARTKAEDLARQARQLGSQPAADASAPPGDQPS